MLKKVEQEFSDVQPQSDLRVADDVPGDEDHSVGENQASDVLIPTIVELWRRRQGWQRAEIKLTLQCFSICRRYVGGDKKEAKKLLKSVEKGTCDDEIPVLSCMPLLAARIPIERERKVLEKELEKMAKGLPITDWALGIRGIGPLTVAGLVGECGNIGSYKSASAFRKRLGLAVINGERQRRKKGDEALLHGYNPRRRAWAWIIGGNLMRSQRKGDFYRDWFDVEKARQLAKEDVLTKGHAQNRAVRHMVKHMLLHFYLAWRAIDRGEEPTVR
jgi:hypothetical protein